LQKELQYIDNEEDAAGMKEVIDLYKQIDSRWLISSYSTVNVDCASDDIFIPSSANLMRIPINVIIALPPNARADKFAEYFPDFAELHFIESNIVVYSIFLDRMWTGYHPELEYGIFGDLKSFSVS
jgi:hypothetical protein